MMSSSVFCILFYEIVSMCIVKLWDRMVSAELNITWKEAVTT
jgi:hypothetical protein